MSTALPGSFEGDTFCRKQIGIHPKTHGYRVLIRAPFLPEKTAGGIIMTHDTRSAHQYRENIGLVLDLGPKCFKGAAFEDEDAPRAAIGDWIYYSSYEKEKYDLNGFLCYYINDDRVHSTVPAEDVAAILKERF